MSAPKPTATPEPTPREGWAQFDAPAAPPRRRGLRIVLIAAGAVLAIAGAIAWHSAHPGTSAPRHESVLVVSVPPLPPPPPVAPPPPEAAPQPRMIEQTPIENDPKPEPPKDEPPPVNLGTNLSSNGPVDGFGLTGHGGGIGTGSGNGSGAPARSRWGWYAAQVQTRVQEALRKDPATHSASLRVVVKLWADRTGRITRAALDESTGNPALDGALREHVLTGLTLASAPPEGMPMPIVLRLTARRP